jgi:hypothetical protein
MSERERVKEYLKVNFPNGMHSDSCYPTYLIVDKQAALGLGHRVLTSGIIYGVRFKFDCKYYLDWQEIYEDVKLYFNPNE